MIRLVLTAGISAKIDAITAECMIDYVPKSSDFKHLNKESKLAKILDEVHKK